MVSRHRVEGLLNESNSKKIEIIPYESEGSPFTEKEVHQVGLGSKSEYHAAARLPLFKAYVNLLLEGTGIDYYDPANKLRLMINTYDFEDKGILNTERFLGSIVSSATEMIAIQDKLDAAYGNWMKILSGVYGQDLDKLI